MLTQLTLLRILAGAALCAVIRASPRSTPVIVSRLGSTTGSASIPGPISCQPAYVYLNCTIECTVPMCYDTPDPYTCYKQCEEMCLEASTIEQCKEAPPKPSPAVDCAQSKDEDC
ncbi:hypothetical protein EJ05DRAFT_99725 [Pseudovirgaria hyperparasitica]|uniref:Uncharacterized protein n=1 Tax=Pseudovirgaria hyperparasitica TaxID=470096 RepID=A0A6A6VXP6_9PEZI|nr:uncharacterized protein EJ05DRAFT_99725 [Pseudovirgaria hyperparasitica]KAF2755382.1 hypothetical protein EJ05DRAFT_99725 [Pseudovirgaria hyperparasitica]